MIFASTTYLAYWIECGMSGKQDILIRSCGKDPVSCLCGNIKYDPGIAWSVLGVITGKQDRSYLLLPLVYEACHSIRGKKNEISLPWFVFMLFSSLLNIFILSHVMVSLTTSSKCWRKGQLLRLECNQGPEIQGEHRPGQEKPSDRCKSGIPTEPGNRGSVTQTGSLSNKKMKSNISMFMSFLL